MWSPTNYYVFAMNKTLDKTWENAIILFWDNSYFIGVYPLHKKKWHYYNKNIVFTRTNLQIIISLRWTKPLKNSEKTRFFFTHMLFLQGLTPYKSHIGKSNNLKVRILHTLTISHMSVKKLSTSARFDSLQMHAGILTLCHTIWPQKWILCKYNIIIKCHNYQHLNKNLRSHLHSM
jgi:hypothetical protein